MLTINQLNCRKPLAPYKNLNIGHWNIEGIRSRMLGNKSQVEDVISIVKQHEIFGLTETHANDSTLLSIPGYVCVKSCRPKNPKARKMSGGTAVLIKKEIAHLFAIIKSKHSDIMWVKIPSSHSRHPCPIYLGFVYISPSCSTYTRSQQQDAWEVLNDEVSLHRTNGTCILMGDFNARVGTECDYIASDDARFNQTPAGYTSDTFVVPRQNRDRTHNAHKDKLLDICIASGLRILNGRTMGDCFGELTCHRKNGSSAIDLCLVAPDILNKVEFFKVGKFLSTVSDHCPISVSIRLPIRQTNTGKVELTKPAPTRLAWDGMVEQMYIRNISSPETRQVLDELATTEVDELNIDQQICKGVEVLCKAAALKPRIKRTKKARRAKNKAWYTKDCAILKSQLRAATRVFERDPFNRNARDIVFSLKKEYKRILRKHKQEYKNTLVNKLENMIENNPLEYWKLVEKLKGAETEASPDDIDESEWLDHYTKLFSARSDPLDDSKAQEQIDRLMAEPHFNELNYRITEKEVAYALRKLKMGKAVGIDRISGEMLRCAGTVVTPWLLRLFNDILLKGIYPQQWCVGIITSLFKSGETHDPNNYRGLTITSCLGKVYNSILNDRLVKFVEAHKILPDNQIGFRKKARTSDHMFIIKTLIDKYVNNKNCKPLYLCFVDLKKAYDSVWHNGLMLKLLQNNIKGSFFQSIQRMYKQSQACIKHQGGISKSFKCDIGVRQGDVLSPLLFNIYVSDMPDFVGVTQDSPRMGEISISCLMYADDMVLMSSSESDLQARLNRLEQYCRKWHLNINEKKTKVMVVTKGRKPSCQIYVCNYKLDQVDKYMYLGIEFSADGKMQQAQLNIRHRSLKAIFKLKSVLRDSNVSPKLSMKLFDQMVKPIALYGCEIWGALPNLKAPTQGSVGKLISKYELTPVEKLHVKYCKYALGVHNRSTNYAILGELGRYPILIDIVGQMLKFLRHIQINESKNGILQEALEESQRISMNGGNSWFAIVNSITKTLNISSNNMSRICIKQAKERLRNNFVCKWSHSLRQQNKMATYCKVKQNYCFENYLTEVKNKRHREAMTKIRTSTHKLMVEKGRYLKIPRADRTCPNCSLNVVEDEEHALIECPAYEAARREIINRITDICPNLAQLDNQNQLVFLLSAEGSIAPLVAKLCCLILK